MTIAEAVKYGISLMPLDEKVPRHVAELILAFVLKKNKEYLIAHDEALLSQEALNMFEELVALYTKGKPLAYISNSKEFYGFDFYVDERVLIPRPETEMLVDEALSIVQNNYSNKVRILDVGTGSGCIAISLAKHLLEADILACDISDDALKVAKKNADAILDPMNIKFVHSDLLGEFANESFDIVVANLPYIGTAKHEFVTSETYDYEPHTALFGGEDGLFLYKKMFQQLDSLNINFSFILGEFGYSQSADIQSILNIFFDHKFYVKSDLAGIDRVFVVNSNSYAR